MLTINSIVYGLQYLFSVSNFDGSTRSGTGDVFLIIYMNMIDVFVFCLSLSLPFILLLFLKKTQEPNPEDPLNKEAAEVLQTNRRLFENNVAKAMRGHSVGGTYFEACLK